MIAIAAVTVDVSLVQFPLVWLGAIGVLAVLAQFKSPISGLAVVLFSCGLLNYSPFEIGALSRLYAGDVAIGHCMRKLLHLVFAVWKTNRPFDEKHFPWEPPSDTPPLQLPVLVPQLSHPREP